MDSLSADDVSHISPHIKFNGMRSGFLEATSFNPSIKQPSIQSTASLKTEMRRGFFILKSNFGYNSIPGLCPSSVILVHTVASMLDTVESCVLWVDLQLKETRCEVNFNHVMVWWDCLDNLGCRVKPHWWSYVVFCPR
jgi:hypothetical protein